MRPGNVQFHRAAAARQGTGRAAVAIAAVDVSPIVAGSIVVPQLRRAVGLLDKIDAVEARA